MNPMLEEILDLEDKVLLKFDDKMVVDVLNDDANVSILIKRLCELMSE